MEGALIRFLNSIADATFWILVILAVGFTVNWTYKNVITFLTEDIKEKKPEE